MLRIKPDMPVFLGTGTESTVRMEPGIVLYVGAWGTKISTVPDECVDSGALTRTRDRIAERYKAWADSGVTGLTISTNSEAIRNMAGVARLNVPT